LQCFYLQEKATQVECVALIENEDLRNGTEQRIFKHFWENVTIYI